MKQISMTPATGVYVTQDNGGWFICWRGRRVSPYFVNQDKASDAWRAGEYQVPNEANAIEFDTPELAQEFSNASNQ